jgi:hypothetical protein
MNSKVLGLACLASLTGSALAVETELQTGPDDLRVGVELLNKHWSHGTVIHPDVTSHGSFDFRWYDVGVHLDGYVVLDGAPGPHDEVINDLETTEVTGRLDYLIEIENYVQIIPFVEATVYPSTQGATRFNWLGIDAWYMLPFEGLEIGGSAQYNLMDNTEPEIEHDNHWLGSIGARQFYQDPPIDLMFWEVVNMASRSYHRITTGADTQGVTTLDLGGKLTLPLPWHETWAYLKTEGHWYFDSDDREALEAAGGDKAELVIAIGFEYNQD